MEYINVINILIKQYLHINFRILALSATPGNDIYTVNQVIKNLKISLMIFLNDSGWIDSSNFNTTMSENGIMFMTDK